MSLESSSCQTISAMNLAVHSFTSSFLSLGSTISFLLQVDPVLIILGATSLVIAILKKDLFILFWAIPNLQTALSSKEYRKYFLAL